MSTPALAAVFLGLAAACYILGLWVNHTELRDCRLELAEAQREAKKYQLALQSCRRRAHRGRLLAQLLREPRYRCPKCQREAPWTDGTDTAAGDERDEFWCQTCGEETPLSECERVSP